MNKIDINKLNENYNELSTGANVNGEKDEFGEFVMKRFSKMNDYKNEWENKQDKTLRLYDVSFDWIITGEDWEKPVRFPTLRDFVQSLKDELVKNEPKADIKAKNSDDIQKALALKFIVEEIKDNVYEKRVKLECLEDMLVYGIGFRKVNYKKVQKKRVINGKEEIITEWDSAGSVRIDPRNVYVDEIGRNLYDPTAHDIKRDVIILYEYSYPLFLDLFKDMEGVDKSVIEKISAVPMEQSFFGEIKPFSNKEYRENISSKIVKVYEYYNQIDDVYAIIANGVTILKPRPIPNKHGRIPLVAYVLEKSRNSFWGISLADLIAPYIYAQETIFNLEFKSLKLRLQPTLALDKSLGFNKRIHRAKEGAVWEFAVQPNESIQNKLMQVPIGLGDSQGFYNMNTHIEDKMTITTNVDRRALFSSPNELATQTAFKNQSLQKRTNSMVYSNEIEAEAHYTEMLISDIKQYMTQPIDKIVKGKITKRPRKMRVEGYFIEQDMEGDSINFVPSQNKIGYFDITEQLINIDVDVEVIDQRSKSMLQEQKTGRILQFIPIATNLINAYAQVNPELLNMLDIKGVIEQAAESIDMDLNRTLKDNFKEKENQVMQENVAILTEQEFDIPEDETKEESEQHLKEHNKLRYKYVNGKLSQEETELWKQMSKKSKDIWLVHYSQTINNILVYRPQQKEQPQFPMVQPQTGQPQPKGVAKSKLPDSKLKSPDAESGLINRTLLA